MNDSATLVQIVRTAAFILLVCALNNRGVGGESSGPASLSRKVGAASPTDAGARANQTQWETLDILKTNRVKRVITNVIEIWMPANQFVDE